MDEKVIKYAKELDALGDKINAVSSDLREFETSILDSKYDELLRMKDILENAIVKYISIRNELAAVSRPAKVEREHHELVDALDELIRGTKMMNQALDVSRMEVTPEQILEGRQLQSKSVVNTKNAVDRIVEKLSR